MAGSSGFAISITAVDSASKTLDSLNKRIAALSAPADRFNKALARFGDTSGLSRLTEGVHGLGSSAAQAFVGLDQMGSRLAAITSVGSIAGIVALERHWANFGNTTKNTAYRLNMPVEKLGSLRVALQLAGGSAADADTGLQGLNDALRAATFKGENIPLFHSLGVEFRDAAGGARHAEDALGDVADAIQRLPDARTQGDALDKLGLHGWLPALRNGRKGLEDFQRQGAQTGAVPTGSMIENATKLDLAWVHLEKDLEGINNRIADRWSGTVTKILENSSRWIENNKKLSDNIAEIGAGVMALGALKPAAWVLRLLGLGAVTGAVGTAATLASPLALSGDTPSDPLLNQAPTGPGFLGQGGTLEQWTRQHLLPSWFGGTSSGGGNPAPITVPRGPTAAAATMQHVHDFFRSKGLSEERTAGILANVGAESGFDPNKLGDHGSSFGLFQYHKTRLTALQRWAGTNTPTEQQQLEYAWQELNTTEKATLDRLNSVNTAGQSGAVFSGFERPEDGPGEAFRRGQASDQFVQHDTPLPADKRQRSMLDKRPEDGPGGAFQRGQAADQFVQHETPLDAYKRPAQPTSASASASAPKGPASPATASQGPAPGFDASGKPLPAGWMSQDQEQGHVHVEVSLKGAPAGTTARVTSSGPVSAPPARIETSMPLVN